MAETARHLRRNQYRSIPWRNGAGVTLEIAREPHAGGEFLWRLSLATVAASGPSSSYPGYRRSVTLLAGNGFQLGIGAQEPVVLNFVGATALFAGEALTRCALLNGPSSDLSLMIREPGAIISVARFQGAAARVVPRQAGAHQAIFCLTGATLLAAVDSPMPGSGPCAEIELAIHDTVLLAPQAAAVSIAASSSRLTELLLLTWRV